MVLSSIYFYATQCLTVTKKKRKHFFSLSLFLIPINFIDQLTPINCETKSTFPKSYFYAHKITFLFTSSLLSKLFPYKNVNLKIIFFLFIFIKYIFLQIHCDFLFQKENEKLKKYFGSF